MRAPGADDVVLTFSGEIYNFTELRQELIAHGHAFVTRSDAEGLAELFSQIGTKTPGHGIYRSLAELRPGTITVAGRATDCARPPTGHSNPFGTPTA